MAGGDTEGRAGSRERAKGFFWQAESLCPCTLPVGMEEVSGSVPGMGLVELLPALSVLQLLAPEQSSKYI